MGLVKAASNRKYVYMMLVLLGQIKPIGVSRTGRS